MAGYGNPYDSNPFMLGRLPSLSAMNQTSNFQTVSPQTMAMLGLNTGSSFNMTRRGEAMPFNIPKSPYLNEDEDPTKPKAPPSTWDKVKNLLTGQSGAAIGGAAQGIGSVIGSYLQTRQEDKRLQEEKRRRAMEEENNARVRELLMPLLNSQLERQKQSSTGSQY